jgi:hypothetical protein
MNPAEQAKLSSQSDFLQCRNESNKAQRPQGEGDEAMMLAKGVKVGVDEDYVLEIVDDALAVEKVVGDGKEVPRDDLGVARPFCPLLFLG